MCYHLKQFDLVGPTISFFQGQIFEFAQKLQNKVNV